MQASKHHSDIEEYGLLTITKNLINIADLNKTLPCVQLATCYLKRPRCEAAYNHFWSKYLKKQQSTAQAKKITTGQSSEQL